jgi:hypothetical protein
MICANRVPVPDGSPGPAPDVAITLVHGTWGRGLFPGLRAPYAGRTPFWFEPESSFVSQLQTELQLRKLLFEIDAFTWSGSNSIAERYSAAKELAKRLQARKLRFPTSTQVIVGHSHGGSVAMLALDILETENISPLIITLATPFVEVLSVPLDKMFELFLSLIRTPITAIIGFAAFYFGVIQASSNLEPLITKYPIYLVAPFLGIYFLSLILLVLWINFYGFALIFGSTRSSLGAQDKVSRLSRMTKGGLTVKNRSRLLVVRAVDDEASMSLAAGAIGNKLSSALFRLAMLTLNIFIAAIIIGSFGANVFSVADTGFDKLFDYFFRNSTDLPLMNVRGWTLVLFPFATLFLLMGGGIFKCVYGRELLFGALRCEINSHSSPDSAESAMIVTLPPMRRSLTGLRHKLYNHERISQCIVNWISTVRFV